MTDFLIFLKTVPKNQKVSIRFKNPVKGSFGLINSSGQMNLKEIINQQKEMHIFVPAIPTAQYFLLPKYEDQWVSKN